MKDIKNILMISGTYVATIIGAGFASGQEILSYFVVYGKRSVFGLVIVCLLFVLCALCVMMRVYKDDITGFDAYMHEIAGKNMCRIMKTCIMLFMFASFCSMAAGSGELFYDSFGIDRFFGVALMLVGCVVVFLFDIKGILSVNAVLAPIMAMSLFVLGVYSFVFRDVAVFNMCTIDSLFKNYIVSAFVYASYNILTTIVILADLRPIITKKSVCISSAIAGGMALFAIAVSIWLAISLYYGKILLGNMPFFTIVARQGSIIKLFYGTVLCFSMFTTAISCGYGVIEWIRKTLKIKKLTAIIVLITVSLPVIMLGFSQIVKNVYSIFGYIGLVMIIYILKDGIKMIDEK